MPDQFKSEFLQTMLERGFVHQCTDYANLDDLLAASKKPGEMGRDGNSNGNGNGPVAAYLGFDATASSLHVGSLLQIMMLRHLQQCGHKPIILLGGGTTRIGDPSGKDESRQMLSDEAITSHMESLLGVFKQYLTIGDGPTDAIVVNNADWLCDLKYLDFLRDYGSLFTVNRMLSFESVKQRLSREQPLTFLEFNYMLLQAYDFVELQRRYGVVLQLGGSDQWGNIVNGVELGRKAIQKALYGLTSPLVTTADGRKMGKSAAGAVWLNRDLVSEYEYWQFWRNSADADVLRFLKLFTDIPMSEIKAMDAWHGAQLNTAKRMLADGATRLLHGESCLGAIHATVDGLFVGKGGAGAGAGVGPNLNSLPVYVLYSTESGSGTAPVPVVGVEGAGDSSSSSSS